MPSDKNEVVKGAVIAKYLSGETKTQITQDLGIAHNTVRRILSEAEIDRHIAETRAVFIEGSYETALNIMEKAKKSARIGLEIMDRTGILPRAAAGATTNVAVGVNFDGMPGLK